MNRIAIVALLLGSFSLISCLQPKLVELAADVKTAATQCYFAKILQIKQEGRAGAMTDIDVSDVAFYAMMAVRGNSVASAPALEAYSAFTNDRSISGKYVNHAEMIPAITSCNARFPKADANYQPKLPINIAEQSTLCWDASIWLSGMAGTDSKDTGILSRSKRIDAAYNQDRPDAEKFRQTVVQPMIDHFGLKSSDDRDALRRRLLAQSLDIGTLGSIIKACPIPGE